MDILINIKHTESCPKGAVSVYNMMRIAPYKEAEIDAP
jgi:hypothetical protein